MGGGDDGGGGVLACETQWGWRKGGVCGRGVPRRRWPACPQPLCAPLEPPLLCVGPCCLGLGRVGPVLTPFPCGTCLLQGKGRMDTYVVVNYTGQKEKTFAASAAFADLKDTSDKIELLVRVRRC